MNAARILKRLTTLVVLVSLCSALVLFDSGRAQAASNNTTWPPADKVSLELRQLIQSGQGNTRVKVIVQSDSSSSGLRR